MQILNYYYYILFKKVKINKNVIKQRVGKGC
jgi:hypothetical protein